MHRNFTSSSALPPEFHDLTSKKWWLAPLFLWSTRSPQPCRICESTFFIHITTISKVVWWLLFPLYKRTPAPVLSPIKLNQNAKIRFCVFGGQPQTSPDQTCIHNKWDLFSRLAYEDHWHPLHFHFSPWWLIKKINWEKRSIGLLSIARRALHLSSLWHFYTHTTRSYH